MFGALFVICGFVAGNALQNLALGKTATQTDTANDAPPGNAVDGNNHTEHKEGGICTHTLATLNAWWEVDLGKIYIIDHVQVFGRTDGSDHRLRQVELYIGYGNNEDDYILREFFDGILPVPYTFQLTSPVYGRWVRITRSSTVNANNDWLTLCEVEVMGDEFSNATFTLDDGKLGTGDILQSSEADTGTECCALCKQAGNCSAVNYNTVTKVCQQLATVTTVEVSSEDSPFYRLP